jgi:hypothetical protein
MKTFEKAHQIHLIDIRPTIQALQESAIQLRALPL